jgi:hypothetical protein
MNATASTNSAVPTIHKLKSLRRQFIVISLTGGLVALVV